MKNLWIAALAAVLLVSCGGRESQNRNKQTTKTEKKMGVRHLTKAEVLAKEWKFLGDKPCIVDFYASWCGPCKMIAPILEELAKEYDGKIDIYKVDTEKEQELAAVFGIRSIPTLLFCPTDGRPQVAQGAMSKADFEKAIDELLLKKQ